MKKKLISTILFSVIGSLFFSFNSFATEKKWSFDAEEKYNSIVFNVTFEEPGEYSIKAIDPSGKEYEGTMNTDTVGVISVQKSVDTGEWIVVASNNSEDKISKAKLEIKVNAQTADVVQEDIKVAKDLTGLTMYFSDGVFHATWNDENAGNINFKIYNTLTSQIIAEGTGKSDEREFIADIPENIEQITVDIVPSTSQGVEGANKIYTLDVVRTTDASVTFQDKKIINVNEAKVTLKDADDTHTYRFFVNDQEIEIDVPSGNEKEVSLPVSEGENDITVFAIDNKKNEVSFSDHFSVDTVCPTLTLSSVYDGIETYDDTVKIEGNVRDFKDLVINDNPYTVEENGNFSFDYSLLDGINTIKIVATDEAGNESVYMASVTKLVKKSVNPLFFIIPGGVIILFGVLAFLKLKKKKAPMVLKADEVEPEDAIDEYTDPDTKFFNKVAYDEIADRKTDEDVSVISCKIENLNKYKKNKRIDVVKTVATQIGDVFPECGYRTEDDEFIIICNSNEEEYARNQIAKIREKVTKASSDNGFKTTINVFYGYAVMKEEETVADTVERAKSLMNKKKKAAENVASEEEKDDKEKKKKFRNDIIQVGIVGVICYLLFFHVISIGHTISGSMEPTISSNAFIFGLRMYYSFEEPKRGDIVAVKPDKIVTEEDKKEMIVCKRLVGLPGDKIEFHNGYLYINGMQIDEEEYLYPDAETNCDRSFEVPEGAYFLLGDNREKSYDSRFWKNTYISKDDLISKVFFWINF